MPELSIRPCDAQRRPLVHLRVPLAEATRAAAALRLPTDPMRWSGFDPAALWIGPDRWLLVGQRLSPEQIIANCRARLGDILHAATDSSDALTCFVVEGSGACRLMGMVSGVDFDPWITGAAHCVRTRIAKLAVVVRSLEEQRFELFVERSASRYLYQHLRRNAHDPILLPPG
jgi:sarcosine oxidase, subunit gamma